MRTARYGVIGLVIAGLAFSAPALGVGGETPADSAGPASTLDLGYDLFVGGISLGKVSLSARFQGGDYKAISTLETKGIVNAFWQAKVEASSNGLVGDGHVQPSLYDSFSQNRSAPRRHATMTFGPEGPKALSPDPPYGDNRYPVTARITRKASRATR